MESKCKIHGGKNVHVILNLLIFVLLYISNDLFLFIQPICIAAQEQISHTDKMKNCRIDAHYTENGKH